MFCYSLVYVFLFASVAILCFLGLIIYDRAKLPSQTYATPLDYWTLNFAFVLYFGWMIYVCLWNLSVVLVDSSVSTNAQYWMALVSLVIFGITSFSTVFWL
jgi:energy-coupling factor transporter transmembrane protein EcfT